MQEEYLHQWIRKAKREKDPYGTQWMKVVSIVQAVFRNRTLADKSTGQTVVLIPKGGGGDFQGIVIVDVLWKTVMGILNRRLPWQSNSMTFFVVFGQVVVLGLTPLRPI